MTYSRISVPGGIIMTTSEDVNMHVTDPFFRGKHTVINRVVQVPWVMDVNTKACFMHGGREIKQISAYHDVYEYGSSVQEVMDAVFMTMKFYGITKDSSLYIEVSMYFELIPILEGSSIKAMFGRTEYEKVPNTWMIGDKRLIDNTKNYQKCVWSSKNMKENNAYNATRHILETYNRNKIIEHIKTL